VRTTKTKTVRVLIYPVDESPRSEMVEPELTTLQSLVSGYIEVVGLKRLPDGGSIDLVCNEEGRLIPLPPNRYVPGVDFIRGQFLIVRHDAEGELASLSKRDVALLKGELP
jgi:hypothetical protein